MGHRHGFDGEGFGEVAPGPRLLTTVPKRGGGPGAHREWPLTVPSRSDICWVAREGLLEAMQALLEADAFEDLPGKLQAAIVAAEQNRPDPRIVGG